MLEAIDVMNAPPPATIAPAVVEREAAALPDLDEASLMICLAMMAPVNALPGALPAAMIAPAAAAPPTAATEELASELAICGNIIVMKVKPTMSRRNWMTSEKSVDPVFTTPAVAMAIAISVADNMGIITNPMVKLHHDRK